MAQQQYIKVNDDQFAIECFNASINAFINSKPMKNGTLLYRNAFATFSDKFEQVKVSIKALNSAVRYT